MCITKHGDNLEYPVFLKIFNTRIVENNPYLICKSWKTECFNETYRAYVIQNSNDRAFCIVNLKELSHFVSYEAHQPIDKNTCVIVPKYEII